jgi:hypothetical protein
MDNTNQYSSYQNTSSSAGGGGTATNLTDAVVDTMVRWPMRMTGAMVDLTLQGVQRMTGGSGTSSGTRSNGGSSTWDSSSSSSSSSSGQNANSGWSSLFSNQTSGTFDQDLSGDDLKYVIWSIAFTKPGYECILQRQQEELVNYSADSSTFAAVKIAKFLDSARHGHSERPEAWGDRYPSNEGGKSKSNRKETTSVITTPSTTTIASSSTGTEQRTSGEQDRNEKGWRIPAEDQKFISFIYRVERRMPKQEDVTRVERVTVERGTRVV